MRVLVLNPGSSTLKASLIEAGEDVFADELVEWPPGDDDSTASDVVGDVLARVPPDPEAVGYRVFHGGMAYRAPSRVDGALLAAVEELDALAPLHNRRAAAVMRAGLAALPQLPHVACFDTGFHADLPEDAWRYPLPNEWVERWGIRRFGFHGLSVAWSVRRAAELLARSPQELRLVVAHLGSGCSVTAVDGGRSVDTSMGYTPFEGPMMGTRSGSVDPGILLHVLRNGISADELAAGLIQRSGLLAVAGHASARDVERNAAGGDQRARMALAMFARSVAAAIASATTALPTLDALIYTGGIGEHSAAIRAAITGRLSSVGLPSELRSSDTSDDGLLASGPPAVLVVRAREDRVIAGAVAQLISGEPSR